MARLRAALPAGIHVPDDHAKDKGAKDEVAASAAAEDAPAAPAGGDVPRASSGGAKPGKREVDAEEEAQKAPEL